MPVYRKRSGQKSVSVRFPDIRSGKKAELPKHRERENKYAYKGCLRMHIILHLNSDKRPQSHTNRYGKSESVNSRSDHIPWQQIAGQSHSCRAAHRVNRAHI